MILCIVVIPTEANTPAPAFGVHVASIVAQYEQYSYYAYCVNKFECNKNIWTVGFGATYHIDGTPVAKTDTMPIGEAVAILHQNLRGVSSIVWELTGNVNNCQLAALTIFTYNVGIGNFQKSALLRLVKQNKFKEAKQEFFKWDKQNGIALAGLTKRRQAEAMLFSASPTECKT